jgi:glycerol-3-phosphate acyltransferase PlsX
MRLALDVMGGDHGSGAVLEGARLALAAGLPIEEVLAVGREDDIHAALKQLKFKDSRLKVIHASEVLTMLDKPVEGLRKKKDCSVLKAVDLVKSGRADAVVSPGNTGGLLAASTIRLRALEGVDRPGIPTVIPTDESQFVLLDSGANVEAKPAQLVQYAVMGSIYSRVLLGVKSPRVGLLSNGTEENKGTELTRQALQLCRKLDLNFLGYVEGHDLFHNKVDVVVCDGFVGNIVLKTVESFAKCLVGMLKHEFSKNPKRKLGALLAYNAFRAIKNRMDPDAYGGAPILGLNGVVIKAHGSARERAIMNAIRIASELVVHRMNDTFSTELAAASRAIEPLLAAEAAANVS